MLNLKKMSEEEGLDEDMPPPLVMAPLPQEDWREPEWGPDVFLEPEPKPLERHPAGSFWTREAFFLFISLGGKKDAPSIPND